MVLSQQTQSKFTRKTLAAGSLVSKHKLQISTQENLDVGWLSCHDATQIFRTSSNISTQANAANSCVTDVASFASVVPGQNECLRIDLVFRERTIRADQIYLVLRTRET